MIKKFHNVAVAEHFNRWRLTGRPRIARRPRLPADVDYWFGGPDALVIVIGVLLHLFHVDDAFPGMARDRLSRFRISKVEDQSACDPRAAGDFLFEAPVERRVILV